MKYIFTFLLLILSFTIKAQCPADLNGSGLIDGEDLLIILSSYGLSCDGIPIYEPRISEIHYNPSTQQGTDSEWEFVEIFNPHEVGLDVSGWNLGDAVDAIIPEGTFMEANSYIVFANDTSSYIGELPPFTILIPFSPNSSLHNSGETIRLLRADGTEVNQVTYSDYNGWPFEPDGGGASLEWRGPAYNNTMPDSWISSNAFGGSPGYANSAWAD
ncbi:MAG: lamin tail domain-containing protein [Flavobacteriales bacterium]|jgi:hypothetical protein